MLLRSLCLIVLAVCSSVVAFCCSLESLVFDIPADQRKIMPDEGWLIFSIRVTNYDSLPEKISLKAICLETGNELARYPLGNNFTFAPGVAHTFTVFMNAECGWNDTPVPGYYTRTIRFIFKERKSGKELIFDQPYLIEIPPEKHTGNSGIVFDF
ncbi:MAG: hypothetical protein KatS3mg031_2654 [Chitinophagales bacterium]|nr:MAG: hypothetical protein KatS3mg031_2654 [Chitinophagales bacterium]